MGEKAGVFEGYHSTECLAFFSLFSFFSGSHWLFWPDVAAARPESRAAVFRCGRDAGFAAAPTRRAAGRSRLPRGTCAQHVASLMRPSLRLANEG